MIGLAKMCTYIVYVCNVSLRCVCQGTINLHYYPSDFMHLQMGKLDVQTTYMSMFSPVHHIFNNYIRLYMQMHIHGGVAQVSFI